MDETAVEGYPRHGIYVARHAKGLGHPPLEKGSELGVSNAGAAHHHDRGLEVIVHGQVESTEIGDGSAKAKTRYVEARAAMLEHSLHYALAYTLVAYDKAPVPPDALVWIDDLYPVAPADTPPFKKRRPLENDGPKIGEPVDESLPTIFPMGDSFQI